VALPHKQRTVNDLFNSQRQSEGMMVVPNNVAIRECIKGLASNKIVALLGDRVFNGHGATISFFGRTTIVPKGPAAFALKTGASIVPGFLIREPGDRYTLCFEPPIIPNLMHSDKDEEMLRILNQCTWVIQEKIKKYPEQWFMFRKFWIS
jgi:KDO2-lipid IV(A) lauroyltransferase